MFANRAIEAVVGKNNDNIGGANLLIGIGIDMSITICPSKVAALIKSPFDNGPIAII